MNYAEKFIQTITDLDKDTLSFISKNNKTCKAEFVKRVILESKKLKKASKEKIRISGLARQENVVLLLAAASNGISIEIYDDDISQDFRDITVRMPMDDLNFNFEVNEFNNEFINKVRESTVVLYTSGTTGKPKKVVIPFLGMCYQSIQIANDLKMTEMDKQLFYMPLNYVYGLTVALSTIYCNACLVESEFSLDKPNSFFNQIAIKGITCFSGVPFTYSLMVKKWGIEKLSDTSLCQMTQAGGLLPQVIKKELIESYPDISFWVMYGQTELGGRISEFNLTKNPLKIDSVGVLLKGVEVHIDFAESFDTEDNDPIGEVFISSPSQLINIDKNIIVKEIDGKRFISTGDMGYFKHNYLYLKGRNNGFVKLAGKRINILEIESKLKQIPGIDEAVVTSIDEKYPVLIIGLHGNLSSNLDSQFKVKNKLLSSSKDKEILIELLPKLPYFFNILDGVLPRLSSGKINYQLLKDVLYENYSSKGDIYIRL